VERIQVVINGVHAEVTDIGVIVSAVPVPNGSVG
jgi:hypothetical protein